MPKVRRSRKSPPEGWELIEPTLEELEQKMREGKINCEDLQYKFLYLVNLLEPYKNRFLIKVNYIF